MESERPALKRSFFREYFFYKLRGTLGIAITSAVLGFIACTLSGIVVFSLLKDASARNYDIPDVTLSITVMFAGLAGLAILAIVTPIVMFRYYRSRRFMDMLGCLPITYREQFWGDFLSGLAAVIVPFSAMAIIGGIFLIISQQYFDILIDKFQSYYGYMINPNLFGFGLKIYVIMLIVIVSGYAIATLVASCCGKAGSAALYSVIALPIIPAIVALYGIFVMNCAVGISFGSYIHTILSCIPPAGTLISVVYDMRVEAEPFNFTITKNPLLIVIALIFIAVLIAAAYFIGKKRKTERVGNAFVVNVMYHILTLLMVLAVIGVYFSANRISNLDPTKILIGAVIALVFYLILELVQYRDFKMIGKSLIRYVCVAVVGFGFLIIGVKSEGFGIGKRLPNQSDIIEVRMTGYLFGEYYSDGGFKYRAEDAISAILAEHRRLLDNPDEIFTGDPFTQSKNSINFIYELKNGRTVSRYYTMDDELCKKVAEKIKQQPVYEVEALGVLNRIDLSSVRMSFKPITTYTHDLGTARKNIKSDKVPELVEMLKYDIINYVDSDNNSNYLGLLEFSYLDDNGKEQFDGWIIRRGYVKVIEFLKNPDNVTDEPEKPQDSYEEYRIHYVAEGFGEVHNSDALLSEASVEIRSDSDSEYAKELMSYFSEGSGLTNEGERFYIVTTDSEGHYVGETYFIPEDKEEAALKAMMNLIVEQTEAIQ